MPSRHEVLYDLLVLYVNAGNATEARRLIDERLAGRADPALVQQLHAAETCMNLDRCRLRLGQLPVDRERPPDVAGGGLLLGLHGGGLLGGLFGVLQLGVSYSPLMKSCGDPLCAPENGFIISPEGLMLSSDSHWDDAIEAALYYEKGIRVGGSERLFVGVGASFVTADDHTLSAMDARLGRNADRFLFLARKPQ